MEERITGTLIWYYYICQREVWLMGHQIVPDQENDNIIIGRNLAQYCYEREHKEVVLGDIKIDTLKMIDGCMCISEVKKSSRYRISAMMQLLYYLKKLEEHGIEARGELRFPKEKIREEITLDSALRIELQKTENDIAHILQLVVPPLPNKNKFCRSCAYAEFCWC